MMNHILVVDDEKSFHIAYKEKFRKDVKAGNYQFSFAADGQEALKLFEHHKDIAVILLDLEMPNMNGIEFMAKIKEAAKHSILQPEDKRYYKIVIVSAYSGMEYIRPCMDNGANEFIVKPIDFGILQQVIDKMLSEVKDSLQLKHLWLAEQKKRISAERKVEQVRGFLNNTMGGGGIFGA